MSTVSKLKAGRKWTVDRTGITSLERDYVIVLDSATSANGEAKTFSGVPAIGSAHPNYSGLFVSEYEVAEGSGADKNTLVVTVKYSTETIETSGSGSAATSFMVDEWGWDDGTDEKELTSGVDGTQVLNSAGDPFESVPKVTTPAPIFTKVMKFRTRQSGWNNAHCKVNASAVTVGGVECPIGSLLCTVAEKRILGDATWKYQYTVRLRHKSNLVKIAQSNTLTDIGWDVAVTDAGMRELDSSGTPHLIRMIDKETGRLCTVTSSALLDGSGAKLADGEDPYNFRFQAYERASFPSWFYSEPSLAEEED